MSAIELPNRPGTHLRRARLGFLGVGWIGFRRLEALAASGIAEVVAAADPVPELRERVRTLAPEVCCQATMEELLELDLDGLVIATPSALHAAQTIAALERGLPVFCQKPLGRSLGEVTEIIDTARRQDLLLGVDLSYRYVRAVREVEMLIREGKLGTIFGARLVFHNAYGPDKTWFYDKTTAGGGCVLDLGIHLVDLALWLLGAAPTQVSSAVYAGGRRLPADSSQVEDYATARLELEGGASVDLACSWRLHAGRDAVISMEFFGTEGGAAVRNVNGSFTEFRAERFTGTSREILAEPPDDWGGRAAVAWAERLCTDRSFDPEIERQIDVAAILDGIYGTGPLGRPL